MTLLDTNLLVYAYVGSMPQHERARAWLDDQFNTNVRIGMPWASLLGFMRLVTNPRVFPRPQSVQKAWGQVQAWLGSDYTWVPQPGDRHVTILGELLTLSGIQGNLVADAHLAALALEHGLTVCSADGDFARFPRLRWINPLAAS